MFAQEVIGSPKLLQLPMKDLADGLLVFSHTVALAALWVAAGCFKFTLIG